MQAGCDNEQSIYSLMSVITLQTPLLWSPWTIRYKQDQFYFCCITREAEKQGWHNPINTQPTFFVSKLCRCKLAFAVRIHYLLTIIISMSVPKLYRTNIKCLDPSKDNVPLSKRSFKTLLSRRIFTELLTIIYRSNSILSYIIYHN